MFKIGGIISPRGQYPDLVVGACGRQKIFKGGQKLVGVFVNGSDPGVCKNFGKGPLEDLAVFKHIGYAGWTAQVVFKDIEFAVRIPDQIRARDMAPDAFGRGKSFHLFAVSRAGHDQIFRDHLIFNDFFIMVDIFKEQIQGMDALLQALFDLLPLPVLNDSGDNVKGQYFFRSFLASIYIKGVA